MISCLDDEELLMDLFNSPKQELTTLKIRKSKKLLKKISTSTKKISSSKKKKSEIQHGVQHGLNLVFEGFKKDLTVRQKMEIIGFASKFFE